MCNLLHKEVHFQLKTFIKNSAEDVFGFNKSNFYIFSFDLGLIYAYRFLIIKILFFNLFASEIADFFNLVWSMDFIADALHDNLCRLLSLNPYRCSCEILTTDYVIVSLDHLLA